MCILYVTSSDVDDDVNKVLLWVGLFSLFRVEINDPIKFCMVEKAILIRIGFAHHAANIRCGAVHAEAGDEVEKLIARDYSIIVDVK